MPPDDLVLIIGAGPRFFWRAHRPFLYGALFQPHDDLRDGHFIRLLRLIARGLDDFEHLPQSEVIDMAHLARLSQLVKKLKGEGETEE